MSSKRRSRELAKLAHQHRVPASSTDDSILDFLSALDHPYSLAIWLLYSNREHQQLVDREIDPLDFNCPMDFRDAYVATEFLSKANFFKLDVTKDQAAFKKFFEYENLCKQTNNRFRNLSLDPNFQGSNVWLLNALTRKISQVLGDYSPEEFIERANWGPGVTTLTKGEHVSAVNKFHSENGITRDLYSLVGHWFPVAYPRWSEHLTLEKGEQCFSFELGNEIVTVPKNSKTDRVIAIEPGLNLWFQKAIGAMIRRRLRRVGIDLDYQATNQLLAKKGSFDSSLATVDFSSASDSISLGLIREVLPPRWFSLLDACRSKIGFHSDNLVRWEKFSSMGNGFTFELESLIFYCAAEVVKDYLSAQGEISVYGDDVILPSSCYDLFSSFSEFLGFRVNRKKSFSSSYFRESCGSHWFDGVDCKPIFLKEKLQNVQAIYKLANRVRDLAHRCYSHNGCDARFRYGWSRLVRRVPKPLRFWVSSGYGDSGFICNFDEAVPIVARDGIEGFLTLALIATGVRRRFEGTGLLLARLKANRSQQFHPLRIADDQGHGNFYDLRGRSRLKVDFLLVPQWYNLGAWL
jgi:hypothetical protein